MMHFEPIDYNFDQALIFDDLMKMNIFDKSFLAMIAYNNGRSVYDQDGHFDDYNDVIHCDLDGNKVEGKFNTFVSYNFTYLPGVEETKTQSFVNTPKGRRPTWHIYDTPWTWKNDTPQSIIDAVSGLNLSYISCVRLVGQIPPSKGVVHADAIMKDNLKYYRQGGVSITLNVSDGGGNLQYRTPAGLETVNESLHKCWHFNDALPHRTTEIYSPRIQIRVCGKNAINKG
jgi:hypothetical protein